MISLFDKIRFRLQDHCESGDCRKFCHECDFKTALRIVDEVEAEYGNGWILVADRHPADGQRVLANVRREAENPIIITNYEKQYYWFDGTIVAWMPLPDPWESQGKREPVADEQLKFISLCQKDMLLNTNMTPDEAWDFGGKMLGQGTCKDRG